MQALVNSLGLAGQKVLVLTDGVKPNVFLSARNLPSTHVMPYADVSTYHILWSDVVLIEAPAIGQDLAPVPEANPQPPAAAKKTTTTAAKKSARAAGAAEGGEGAAAAKKTARKSAAKKSAPKAEASSAKKPAAAKKRAPKKGEE
jgi:hypothetical protein